MSVLTAVFVQVGLAFIVHHGDVVPKDRLSSLCLVCLLVNALLTEVLQHNLLAGQSGRADCTIHTVSEAVSLLELIVTCLAGPEQEVRRHPDAVAKLVIDDRKVLDEVKGLIID